MELAWALPKMSITAISLLSSFNRNPGLKANNPSSPKTRPVKEKYSQFVYNKCMYAPRKRYMYVRKNYACRYRVLLCTLKKSMPILLPKAVMEKTRQGSNSKKRLRSDLPGMILSYATKRERISLIFCASKVCKEHRLRKANTNLETERDLVLTITTGRVQVHSHLNGELWN